MLDRFAECVEPRNIIEWMWVKDIVDLCWEINRLRRFRTLIIEKELEGQGAEIEADAEDGDDSDEDNDEREKAAALNIEAASVHFLCWQLGTYETIDRLLVSAELRRDRILRELELRRERIAPLLRKASDQMIEDRSQEITLAPK